MEEREYVKLFFESVQLGRSKNMTQEGARSTAAKVVDAYGHF